MGAIETSEDQPLYTAVYRQRVDEKRRLQIPAKWRGDGPSSQLALALWPSGFDPHGCLMVFPVHLLKTLAQSLRVGKPFNDEETNAVRRFIGERADTAVIDKAGRVVVPDAMAKAAGIGKEAVMVGMLDRFQIWEPKKYEASRAGIEMVAANAWQKF